MKTYGNLYRKLTSTTGEIPIGIYRTKQYFKTPNIDNLVSLSINFYFFIFCFFFYFNRHD